MSRRSPHTCLFCHKTTTRQPIFQWSVTLCYHCYSLGFSQSALQNILGSLHFQGIAHSSKIQKESMPPLPTCITCSVATELLTIQGTSEHKENVRIFPSWKYWFDYHKRGQLQIYRCQKCHVSWMNIRTFCKFKIDWEHLEASYKDLRKSEEDAKEPIVGSNLFQFLMGYLLGIPQLQNIPASSELPLLTYLSALVIGYFTSRGLNDSIFYSSMVFDPTAFSVDHWSTLISYVSVHSSRSHFFRVILFFLVFTPMVEHELSPANFITFLVVTSAGTALLQMAFAPHVLIGLGGVVSGILTFFCFRFPASVIGIGLFRFTAPVALVSFMILNRESEMGLIWKLSDSTSYDTFTNLGGAFIGYLFHLTLPKGKSTQAFEQMAKRRLQYYTKLKNWNRS